MDEYLKVIFKELYCNDGMVVMGHGLGVDRLFCKFLQYYAEKSEQHKKPLVFCLNVNNLETAFTDLMLSDGVRPDHMPKTINNEVTSAERIEMYKEGGCFFVTSRILIVDMLDGKIDFKLIGGLLIYNAHRIAEYSIDSFVIRLFRENNPSGFIKAFSEDPENITNSFHKIEKLLKTLYLKKLFLWPRFRLEIAKALEGENCIQPNVLELSLPLTNHMKTIQNSILVAMETCLQELKKSCPTLETFQTLEDTVDKEIKGGIGSSSVNSGSSYFNLENLLFHHFDYILRNQLDAEWHKLSFKTKQLISDITTLRQLLDYLVRYDAFSFYYLLTKIQATSSEQQSPSLWLMSEAGNQIFKHAKERLYSLESTPNKREKSSWKRIAESHKEIQDIIKGLSLTTFLEPVLECPPKWKVLSNLMKEIHSSRGKDKKPKNLHPSSSSDLTLSNDDEFTNNRVVIVVRDELAMTQLKDVLLHGSDYVIEQRFRWFISQQSNEIKRKYSNRLRSISSTSSNPSHQSAAFRVNSSSSLKGSALTNSKSMGGNPTSVKQTMELFEKELIQQTIDLSETSNGVEMKEKTDGTAGDLVESLNSNQTQQESLLDIGELQLLPLELQLLMIQNKILQLIPSIKSTQDKSFTQDGKSKKRVRDEVADDKVREDERFKTYYYDPSTYEGEDNLKRRKLYEDADDPKPQQLDIEYKGEIFGDSHLLIQIVTHNQIRENFCLFSSLQPTSLILYDSDVFIVRKIETYQSTLTDRQLKVYFLNYDGSTEEHRYVGYLAKEKKAFESLIRAKEHLVISLPDNSKELLYEKQKDLQENAMDSRSIKNQQFQKLLHRKIVIDVREFRSSLPLLLYNQHFHLIPRTITVGDYILSPEIAIERKGISDLFQSFASGRLYNQMEQMSKYYKYPMLLIEFALEKSFCLVSGSEVSSDIQVNSIISKIVLLVQSFPNLRILWSRSPQQTSEIFRLLMINHDEVDVQKAVTVGNISNLTGEIFAASEQGDNAGNEHTADNFTEKEYYRYSAQEILLSLPGINSNNYRNILNHSKIKTLADLSRLKENELSSIIGPGNAKKLYAFFHHKQED